MSALFGSTARKPSATPKPAGLDHRTLPSNERGIARRYLAGVSILPVTWIGGPYRWKSVDVKQKVGKKKETIGHNNFADCVGALCYGGLGVDEIRGIEINREMKWTGSVSRGGAGSPTEHSATITIPGYGVATIYWGTTGQGIDPLLSGHGHPAYRRRCVIVFDQLFWGQDSTTAPTVRVVLFRKPQVGGLLSAASYYDSDANPAHVLLELLLDPVIGLRWPSSRIDLTSWDAAAAQLITEQFAISPVLDREEDARTAALRICEYIGGFVYRTTTGKLGLRLARPFSGDPATLPLWGEYDFTEPPQLEIQDWADTSDEVFVRFTDRDSKWEGDSEPWRSPTREDIDATRKAANEDRPWITNRTQAAKAAAAIGRVKAVPSARLKARVLRRSLTGVKEGDFVRVTYRHWNRTAIFRLVRWSVPDWRSAEADVELLCDGWQSALLPYMDDEAPSGTPPTLPAPQPAVPGMPSFTPRSGIDPSGCYEQRLVELPYDLVPASADRTKPHLAAFVARSTPYESRLVINVSEDDSTYHELVQYRTFQRVGRLVDNVGATPLSDEGSDGLLVTLGGADNDAASVPATTAAGLLRQECLVFIQDEIIAYRDVDVISANVVRLRGLRRAQFESFATAHIALSQVWIVRREDVSAFTAPEFKLGTLVYIKAAPSTEVQAQDLADVVAMSVTPGVLPITPYVTPPSIDPPTGTYSGTVTVSVAVGSGLTLRFTADGTAVRSSSPEWATFGVGNYISDTVTPTTVLRFRTFNAAGFYSEEVQRTYASASTSSGQVATPTVAKTGRRGVAGVVTLACATSGAAIKYSVNGGSYSTYSAPFNLAAGDLLVAYGEKSGMADSETIEFSNIASSGGGGGGVEP